jgi:ATPase family associated with various cellular activities (AAA)
LWIYGIPGAGKTILSAALANRINIARVSGTKARKGPSIHANKRTSDREEAFIFYYCHHSRKHDETSHFLRWVLSQLSRQADAFPVPETIIELYRKSCEPQVDDLLAAIREVTGNFSKVTISIDAIDESQNRGVLATILSRLADTREFNNPDIRILLTSRHETDLQEHLTSFETISMSNSYVDSDILHFVKEQVNGEAKFKKWSQELRNEVISTLAARAQGM